jgi:hypothetical protein
MGISLLCVGWDGEEREREREEGRNEEASRAEKGRHLWVASILYSAFPILRRASCWRALRGHQERPGYEKEGRALGTQGLAQGPYFYFLEPQPKLGGSSGLKNGDDPPWPAERPLLSLPCHPFLALPLSRISHLFLTCWFSSLSFIQHLFYLFPLHLKPLFIPLFSLNSHLFVCLWC